MAFIVVPPNEFAKAILKSLGIDPDRVQALTFHSEVGRPEYVDITFVTHDAVVPTFSRRYELKLVER